jgi:hypothetical protein
MKPLTNALILLIGLGLGCRPASCHNHKMVYDFDSVSPSSSLLPLAIISLCEVLVCSG